MSDRHSTRREALRRIGGGAAVLCAGSAASLLTLDDGSTRPRQAQEASRPIDRRPAPLDGAPDLVVARRASPRDLVRAALEPLGGMSRFIERGDRVLIKPNIGWDRVPMLAANTNPEVVATLVTLCREAGAREVVVGDVSCNDARRAYDRSGIARAAADAGAEVVLPDRHRFRPVDFGGDAVGTWSAFEPLLSCQKIINTPVLKNHTLAGMTGASKNWYGILGGRRARLHQSIHESIADLTATIRPTLTLVDAVRVMYRNGPTGGAPSDTRRLDTVVAAVDQIAADAYACRFIGLEPRDLAYLALAARRGAGHHDVSTLTVREVDLG